jgi:hypothetical protein
MLQQILRGSGILDEFSHRLVMERPVPACSLGEKIVEVDLAGPGPAESELFVLPEEQAGSFVDRASAVLEKARVQFSIEEWQPDNAVISG